MKDEDDFFKNIDKEAKNVASESESRAILEEKLIKKEKQLKTERYIWIISVIILIDIATFKGSADWSFPIIILVLEVILLLVIGRAIGVEDVMTVIDKIFYNFGSSNSANNKNKTAVPANCSEVPVARGSDESLSQTSELSDKSNQEKSP